MISKSRRISTPLALLLAFATVQVYLGLTFAAPKKVVAAVKTAPATPGQQPMGSLITQGNKPITVNGASAVSGSTVLSGASIETPAGVGATVDLGALGSLQIDPSSKLTLDFQNGSVRILVLGGCVILKTKQGTAGEVDTTQGVAGRTDAAQAGEIKVCAPGSVPPAPPPPGDDHGGLFGLGTAATTAIVLGGIVAVAVPLIILNGGSNPSPVRP